jgi:hypothetical protein
MQVRYHFYFTGLWAGRRGPAPGSTGLFVFISLRKTASALSAKSLSNERVTRLPTVVESGAGRIGWIVEPAKSRFAGPEETKYVLKFNPPKNVDVFSTRQNLRNIKHCKTGREIMGTTRMHNTTERGAGTDLSWQFRPEDRAVFRRIWEVSQNSDSYVCVANESLGFSSVVNGDADLNRFIALQRTGIERIHSDENERTLALDESVSLPRAGSRQCKSKHGSGNQGSYSPILAGTLFRLLAFLRVSASALRPDAFSMA